MTVTLYLVAAVPIYALALFGADRVWRMLKARAPSTPKDR